MPIHSFPNAHAYYHIGIVKISFKKIMFLIHALKYLKCLETYNGHKDDNIEIMLIIAYYLK